MGRVRATAALFSALAAALSGATSLAAQSIPRDEYLTYIPLEYPLMVRQTAASADLAIYGDRSDPGYRDVAPADGIDDGRAVVLRDLGVRFAPYMTMNSYGVPMDWRKFMDRGTSFPLYVDEWNTAGSASELVSTEEIDWVALLRAPCEPGSAQALTGNPDCRLLSLLDEFDPLRPGSAYREGATAPERTAFKVMFFDFPGDNEESWEEAYVDPYSGRLRREYEDFVRIYMHPFLVEVRSNDTGEVLGYEFALQYWFFYPFNDGGNNHEGDWEHINVMIAPLSRVDRPLSAEDVRWVLDGGGMSDSSPDRLVIRRIDYYMHHNVWTIDYTRPNVYLSREEWQAEVKNTVQEVLDEDWQWKKTRYYAYWDEEETIINTHPIAYIGADNKGTDQLLKAPGGSNRDSHGTYPFPALYKDIGPGGAAEQVPEHFDHRAYYAAGGDAQIVARPPYQRGYTISFASPERVQVIPDGERVNDLVKTNPRARRDWSWLVLPIRWGYPAAKSPFAGIVAHAETGNISVFGPSYSGGWNRIGDSAGFHNYSPNKFSALFPTTWQDGFANNLGWLNLTLPTLIILPPFDLLWRVVLQPVRAVVKTQDPILHPSENLPYRFIGIVVLGPSYMFMSNEFADLFINENQIDEIVQKLAQDVIANDTIVGEGEPFVTNDAIGYAEITLYLGSRFSTENMVRHGRIPMGLKVPFPSTGASFRLHGDLNFWEYSGSLRYNLATGGFQPFFKLGYGLSWYRIEGSTINGEPMDNPDGPWVRQPTFKKLSSLLPNTWHAGAGMEWVPIRSYAGFPKGIDLGIRGDFAVYTHNLGLSIPSFFVSESGFILPVGKPQDTRVWRPVINLAVTVSF